jgi:predicted transglutaminase-like cysteine proteinase
VRHITPLRVTALRERVSARLLAALFAALCGALIARATVDFDRLQATAASRYDDRTVAAVVAWQEELLRIDAAPTTEKLERVNRFFNARLRWRSDEEIWGQNDYWATPLESLWKAEADCEDFSIAKYVSLMLAGIDPEALRITYVKARLGSPDNPVSQAHMVLAYYPEPGAEPLILDNLIADVRPASARPDLTPVFGFNSRGIWVAGRTSPATTDPGSRLSRWRNLLQRMAEEGIE